MPSSDQQLATIVVIDDEPGIVDFVELGLRHEGFAVLSAGTIAAGLDLVRREHPDLVIVDVGLPDGDGFELLRRKFTATRAPMNERRSAHSVGVALRPIAPRVINLLSSRDQPGPG
jgi:two-component system KDP operon response regulator KdpE